MSNGWLIPVLIAAFLLREVFFQYELQKLVNKLMSRDYQDYRVAQSIQAPKGVTGNGLENTGFEEDYKDSDLETLNKLI